MKNLIFIATIASFILLSCSNSRKANKQTINNKQTPDTLGTADNDSIVNKYWKLITLEGKEVTINKN